MAVDEHPTHIEIPPLRDISVASPNETERGTPEMDYYRPISPLQMPPGQIDGLAALKADEYMNGRRGSGQSSMLHLQIPGMNSPADVAFAAMHYLPYPVIVLNGSKRVILANEATARLLDTEDGEGGKNQEIQAAERYKGQTISQLGIDMMKDLKPIWVTWEPFLDSLADEINVHAKSQGTAENEGDMTPTAERAEPRSRTLNVEKNTSVVHDAVVEVVITAGLMTASTFAGRTAKKMVDRRKYTSCIFYPIRKAFFPGFSDVSEKLLGCSNIASKNTTGLLVCLRVLLLDSLSRAMILI